MKKHDGKIGSILMNSNVLYISYDGLSDPLGKSQVIPYLKELSKKGINYSVLSFEKFIHSRNKKEIQLIARELKDLNIRWRPMKYHKAPAVLSTFYDLLRGCFAAFIISKKNNVRIIHVRSHVSCLIGLFLKMACGKRLIFDMRGFWADERTEAGIWKRRGLLYKVAKYFEKVCLLNCDQVISLTFAAETEIRSLSFLNGKRKDITVIPTCVNLDKFFDTGQSFPVSANLKNKIVLVYSGSISTWCLPEAMLDFFLFLNKKLPESHLLVLTPEKKFCEELLKRKKTAIGNVSVFSAPHEDVPGYLLLASAGLAFYRPGYSRKGCCPTKVGEYLACGLPVIINSGIGDMDDILRNKRVGIIMEDFSEEGFRKTADELKVFLSEGDILRKRCRMVAEELFSLKAGAERYFQTYNHNNNP